MEEPVEYNARKKEERIFITTIDRAEDIDEFCVYGRDCMTRSEAIEKMAKALAFVQAKTFVDKNQWEIVMLGCRYEAEAALDALLEGE